MIQTIKQSPHESIQEFSVKRLLNCLKDAQAASQQEVAGNFTMLRRLVESMPQASGEFCFALNWITSARTLWENGDHATAHYQIGMVARKLSL